jgi:hypothetical protein
MEGSGLEHTGHRLLFRTLVDASESYMASRAAELTKPASRPCSSSSLPFPPTRPRFTRRWRLD